MVKEADSFSINSNESNEYENEKWDSQLQLPNSNVAENGGAVILQQNGQDERQPTFGNISVTNGSDIHFGNKTFYQGSVTIQQFVYANGDKELKKVSESEVFPSAIKKLDINNVTNNLKIGIDNPSYDQEQEAVPKNGDIKVRTDVDNSDVKVDRVEQFEGRLLKKFVAEYKIALATSVTFILFLVIVATLLAFILRQDGVIKGKVISDQTDPRDDDEHEHNTPIKEPIDPNNLKPTKLKMVSRLEWLAQPPIQPTDPLKTPVPYVIISHTATENCSSQAQCVFQVRFIQTFHMESRGWWDIGYNFLIGGDGEAYIGRGWEKEGSHTYGYNKASIGIAFIGTFINTLPPKYQLETCKQLIAKGVELGYLKKDYKLLGARQLQATKSPGDELYAEIQKWPHWADGP
ncbi:hypothetical protein WA026_013758 [Henosepilachna vigintioctopunctata]|uniref:Uncharacterized protein n=1 Tax=Henosepilachna vigintioctopunctata TaxID=420089 RepID=A0AAW1UXS7_9CUCU